MEIHSARINIYMQINWNNYKTPNNEKIPQKRVSTNAQNAQTDIFLVQIFQGDRR